MRRTLLTGLVLLLLVGIGTVFYIQGQHGAYSYYDSIHRISANRANANIGDSSNAALYIYFTLKQSTGFVLARAPRGSSGQPLGDPQSVVRFSNDFGLAESDSVLSSRLMGATWQLMERATMANRYGSTIHSG